MRCVAQPKEAGNKLAETPKRSWRGQSKPQAAMLTSAVAQTPVAQRLPRPSALERKGIELPQIYIEAARASKQLFN